MEGSGGARSRPGSFVGRAGELAALREALDAGGATVVVRGTAGIGKSRLVRELGAHAVGRGGVVVVGRATAAVPPATLRPLREALLAAGRQGLRPGDALTPFVPVLASLVPEWGPPGNIESPMLLAEAVLRLLGSFARTTPTLLVLEDLQWADPETLAVVEYVADNLPGSPVLVVATVRDGEPSAGTDLAAGLVARRVASEIRLAALAPAEVVAVARSCAVDGEVPAELEAVLVDRSEGVPFLVEELVATADAAGWETVAAAVPGSVVTSVERRLEQLADDTRRLLVASALTGRFFDWQLTALAAGLDDDAAAGALREAVRAQLVEVRDQGFRFRHGLTRDAVLAVTPAVDVELMARRLLDELTVGGDGRPVAGEHRLLAAELSTRLGLTDRAARMLLDAARDAVEDGALPSAEALALRARQAGTDEWSGAADEVLLRVYGLAGRADDAVLLGERLLTMDDDPLRQADIRALLGSAELAAGRWDAASAHADAVVALVPADRARVARADVLAAQAAMGRDDVDEAAARAHASLAGARTTAQLDVQCEALEVIGRILRGEDLGAAEAAFQEAFDIASANGLAISRVRALQELGTIDMYDGLDLGRLQEARRQAVALGALSTAAIVDLQLAVVHDERGEMADALATALRCSEVSRRFRLSTLPMSYCVQAMVHARLGDRIAMQDAVARARETGGDAEYVEAGVWGNIVPVFDLVQGDLPAAATALDRAMDVIRHRPAATLPYPGLWALVRTLLDDDGAAARSEVASLRFDTPVSRRTLVAAEAVAAGAHGDPSSATARFAEADAALAAQDGGFRQPFVRLLVAPAAGRDGWGDPVTWLRESLARFEQLGLDALAGRCRRELRSLGAAVPRRTRAETVDAVPPGLAGLGVTAREVDVLVLVARGATNREVAERLVISQRTVDKHVERLLQKTGTTRSGLGGIARDAGLLRT